MLKLTLLSLMKILDRSNQLYVVFFEKTKSGHEVIQFVASRQNNIQCYTTIASSVPYNELRAMREKVPDGFLVILQYDIKGSQIASCTHQLHKTIKTFIEKLQCRKAKIAT